MTKQTVDTTEAGTWMCSFIAETALRTADDVFSGAVIGEAKEGWLGLEEGTHVFITVDENDWNLYHVKALEDKYYVECFDEEEEEVTDPWELETVVRKTFRVEIKEFESKN